jgi:hypothetical protein
MKVSDIIELTLFLLYQQVYGVLELAARSLTK